MPINPGMMSSDRDDWETPDDLFKSMDDLFHFGLDAAASHKNAKVAKHYTREENGLLLPWNVNTWVNPPYGRQIPLWVEKAYMESNNNGVVVCMLMAARTDTIYFHRYVMRAWMIWFVKGRIRFVGAPGPAPFPSMLVFFDGSLIPGDYPMIYSCLPNGELL